MARRKQARASSGAPGITNGIGPALNPLGINQPGRFKHGHYLDPHQALLEIEHPSARWAGFELKPIRPRQ
jgi:hypothetical protein